MSEAVQEILQRIQQLPEEDLLALERHLAQLAEARQEQEEWRHFGAKQLARAYGPNEPEYTEADLKPELNS